MEVAKIKITGTDTVASDLKKITSGMIGATVSIEYDDTWADLNKQVVFKGPCGTVNAEGNTIPPEVLRTSGFRLEVGVYGYSGDGSVAIPTVWASLGMIRSGADPEGDEAARPTLPVWARMQNQIGSLDELSTEAKASLVAAINELAVKGMDQEQIDTVIEQALAKAKESGEFDGEPGPVGPAGADGKDGLDGKDGEPGSPGADGQTPKISIGKVETLEAGSEATATMTGTAADPILNLGIPKGANGQTYEIPTFDLVAMGLPVIEIDGDSCYAKTDITEIVAAMERGLVRITFAFSYGGVTDSLTCIAIPLCSNGVGIWELVVTGYLYPVTMRAVIMFNDDEISAFGQII